MADISGITYAANNDLYSLTTITPTIPTKNVQQNILADTSDQTITAPAYSLSDSLAALISSSSKNTIDLAGLPNLFSQKDSSLSDLYNGSGLTTTDSSSSLAVNLKV